MEEKLRKEIQQAINDIEEGENLTLDLSDGDTIDLCAADFFIGGTFENEEIMCDMLGNVMYHKGRILREVEDFLAEDDITIINIA